jgi:hypothetical protein
MEQSALEEWQVTLFNLWRRCDGALPKYILRAENQLRLIHELR